MKNILFAIAALSLLSLPSCTEVIELDLNAANPQIVVEGAVNDQPGPYFVKISRSQAIDESNNFPPVTSALVVISGSDGSVDTLIEQEDGLYATSHLQGKVGITYTLLVEIEGNRFTATSTMPRRVELDTAYTSLQTAMGGENRVPILDFQDPGNENNQYNLVVKKAGLTLPGFFTVDDDLRDGEFISRPLRNSNFKLQTGDVLQAELQCVDQPVYQYFYVLGQAAGTGMSQSPTPSNPTGNISGGDVLGYFSAYTSSIKIITVP